MVGMILLKHQQYKYVKILLIILLKCNICSYIPLFDFEYD